MRRCEDEKIFYRPPLLEEPCAQTLSGKNHRIWGCRSQKNSSRSLDRCSPMILIDAPWENICMAGTECIHFLNGYTSGTKLKKLKPDFP